ncbi:MAG: DNA-3-methyladenine glycosylase I [Acidobacteriota bacterium]
MSYCDVVRQPATDPCHLVYHDSEYGFPTRSDTALFERLILEINQAGLSWTTILKKRKGFRQAYAGFDIATVAAFGDKDRERLLADAAIIRNRLKVDAAIRNANTALRLIGDHGSLAAWLDSLHPLSPEAWGKAFKKTFVFTGGEIVREFLLSTGYLAGAHEEACPVHGRILKLAPPWLRQR